MFGLVIKILPGGNYFKVGLPLGELASLFLTKQYESLKIISLSYS
jgi:hypothetical protein